MSECGGYCFEGFGHTNKHGNALYWRKKNGNKCPCKLQKCAHCKAKVPALWLDCYEGCCSYKCVFESKGLYGLVE